MTTEEAKVLRTYYQKLHRKIWWNIFGRNRMEKLVHCKLKISKCDSIIYNNRLHEVKTTVANVASFIAEALK